jgi:hypothetical protein
MISQEKNSLNKENKLKNNIMQSQFQMDDDLKNIKIKQSSIMGSNIFFKDSPKIGNEEINKSISPFDNIGVGMEMGGDNIKGSISPFGTFAQEKEEKENIKVNKESIKDNNLEGLDFEFGGQYVDDDNETEEMPPKEIITSSNSKSRYKKSSLGMSIKNSIFGFNAQNDELKKENDSFKKRDDLKDIIKEEDEIKSSMKSNDNL